MKFIYLFSQFSSIFGTKISMIYSLEKKTPAIAVERALESGYTTQALCSLELKIKNYFIYTIFFSFNR